MIKLTDKNINLLKDSIEQSGNLLILTHSNPDGDTVGAALALAGIARQMNKTCTLVSPDEIPDFLQWIPGARDIIVWPGSDAGEITQAFEQADTLFCMDFNAAHRTGNHIGELAGRFKGKKVLIDHHLFPDEPFFDVMFSFPEASSTSELLFHIIRRAGWSSLVGRQEAVALAVGIITDTGSFVSTASFDHPYPTTKIQWIPDTTGAHADLVGTTVRHTPLPLINAAAGR